MRNFFGCALALALLLGFHSAGADLHDPTNSADYVILCPASVLQASPWISQLATWRAQHGRTAMVVPTDSIWAQFGSGVPSDSVLKDFLFYAYDHWSPPQLRDVFVIGWHDVVPSHVRSSGEDQALSDYYFTARTESDTSLPNFAIGRLPWSPTQTPLPPDYYSKVLIYESQDSGAWRTRVHLIADVDEHADFAAFSEGTIAYPGFNLTPVRDYLSYPAGDPWHGDTLSIMQHWNEGSMIVMPMCRADFGTWGYGLHLTPEKLATLSNGWRLPIVFGVENDASFNTFELSGIPRALLFNMAGGAIAYFGMTNYAYVGSMIAYRRAVIQDVTSGPAQTTGDLWFHAAGMTSPGIHAVWCMLMGDPALRLPLRSEPVADDPAPLPEQIRLIGNYPNPFNPSTEIQFELPRAMPVSLKIMNILGQHIATLLDGPRAAGTHTAIWTADSHPSGLYFAVLEAGNVRQVRKMMLLK